MNKNFNIYNLGNKESWKIINDLLLVNDWTQDEIDNISEESLKQVMEVINDFFLRQAEKNEKDPKSIINKRRRCIKILNKYFENHWQISEEIIKYIKNHKELNFDQISSLLNAPTLKLFKDLSDEIGEEIFLSLLKMAVAD